MKKSDSIVNLAAALTKAQANIGAATKGAENPFFKSHYADLAEIIATCKQALLEQGISVLQLIGKNGEGSFLETVLLHESGEYISESAPIVCIKNNDPQAFGSAVTYQRRYALQSALLIPSDDDDGERAMKVNREIDADNRNANERQARREQEASAASREAPRTAFQAVKQTMSQPTEQNDSTGDWRNSYCTYGRKDGPIRGKQLGELTDNQLNFLTEKFLHSGLRPDQKDVPMCEALAARELQLKRAEAKAEVGF